MFAYVWPIGLIVLSNILYHVCAKSTPADIDPFFSLTVTYVIGAVVSLVLYFILSKNAEPTKEFSKINWSVIALGIVIVGLEVGNIFAYRAGWQVNTQSMVQEAFLAIALIIVGYFAYKEKLSLNKIIGVGACLIGLFFINKNS